MRLRRNEFPLMSAFIRVPAVWVSWGLAVGGEVWGRPRM